MCDSEIGRERERGRKREFVRGRPYIGEKKRGIELGGGEIENKDRLGAR